MKEKRSYISHKGRNEAEEEKIDKQEDLKTEENDLKTEESDLKAEEKKKNDQAEENEILQRAIASSRAPKGGPNRLEKGACPKKNLATWCRIHPAIPPMDISVPDRRNRISGKVNSYTLNIRPSIHLRKGLYLPEKDMVVKVCCFLLSPLRLSY